MSFINAYIIYLSEVILEPQLVWLAWAELGTQIVKRTLQ